MSRNFKNKIDSLLDNDRDITAHTVEDKTVQHHSGPPHTRPLIIVQHNGDEKLFHYNYLIAADYHAESGTIVLYFTTHTVSFKGLRLHQLFRSFCKHEPFIVTVTGTRYDSLLDKDTSIITEVIIIEKD